jgi:phage terminase small subunit
MSPQRPPADLSTKGTKFWNDMLAERDDLDPHKLSLLEIAARALDEIELCRKVLKRDGLLLATEHSKKAHPAIAIERGAREDFVRACRLLKAHTREEAREQRRRTRFRVMEFPRPPRA